MFTLIEPLSIDMILDRPDLGCAMITASCEEKGIKTILVKGQTRYLRDMFVNDTDEMWHLINDLKEDSLKEIGIFQYRKSVREKGKEHFKQESRPPKDKPNIV